MNFVLFMFLSSFSYEFIQVDAIVVSTDKFDPSKDAAAIRKAVDGWGTDEKTLVEIITKRSNAQRMEIRKRYNDEIKKDILKDLRHDISGRFEDVIVGLMRSPLEFLCDQLHDGLFGAHGIIKDADAVIEVLVTRNEQGMKDLATQYEQQYERPMVEHVIQKTSGNFQRLLANVITSRNWTARPDFEKAKEQAKELHKAGEEKKWGTDESVFTEILGHSSYPHLLVVFDEYKKQFGKGFEDAVKSETSGPFQDLMLAIIDIVRNPINVYFAKQLKSAVDRWGTSDDRLIRVCISRSEMDLHDIKVEFQKIHGQSLEDSIKKETSGHYREALLNVVAEKA